MDRLLAHGTVNAAQRGEGPPLFLLHSLLSDRASFDAVAPQLSRFFRVIVPELPGFGGSQAVGGSLTEVADRMAILYLGRMVAQDDASAFDRQSIVEYMTTGGLGRTGGRNTREG